MITHDMQRAEILSQAPTMWTDATALEQIRKSFAHNLTTNEFAMLVEMGKATGLNPYLREIWAMKYGNNPAQIFIGRDGYRKSAQSNPMYDYHVADAVHVNDEFQVSDGEIKHKYSLADRGALVGAYCIVKRKDASRPMFVYVDIAEYSTNQSPLEEKLLKRGKPATMIKKVAEAQALRMAFQALFAGTYHEYEQFADRSVPSDRVNILNEKLGLTAPVEVIQADEPDQITLAGELEAVIDQTKFNRAVLGKWLAKAGVETIEEMPAENIQKCIDYVLTKTESKGKDGRLQL